MNIVLGDYVIAPYPGGTCWQIYRKAPEGSKAKARRFDGLDGKNASIGKYPTTVRGAVEAVAGLMERDGGGCVFGKDELVSRLLEIEDEVRALAERVEKAVGCDGR